MSGHDDVRRTTPGVKLTYDDFLLFPDDGKRHELIDGVLELTVKSNDTLATPILPGLQASLTRIFKD